MNKKLSLSVITLTKNRAKLLDICLHSLLGQLAKEDEIIVVDNGSTDDTPSIIASHKRKLPIRSFRVMKGSYPDLYNVGVSHAKNDIIVFLDDDCRAGPTFLARTRRAHITHSRAVIQGITYSIPKGNIYVDVMGDHYKNWLHIMSQADHTMRTFDNKNASISRSLFRAFGGFSKEMSRGSEDIEFGLRLRRNGIRIFLDRTIVAYHHERATLSGFLSQHRRIAIGEGYLDRIIPPSERLGVIPTKKLFLHLRSFLQREKYYLSRGKIKNAFILPFLYLALAWIRTTGYAKGR